MIDVLLHTLPGLEEAVRIAKERTKEQYSICQDGHHKLLAYRGSDSPDRDECIYELERNLENSTYQWDRLEDAVFESEMAVVRARERRRFLEAESQSEVIKLRSLQRASAS